MSFYCLILYGRKQKEGIFIDLSIGIRFIGFLQSSQIYSQMCSFYLLFNHLLTCLSYLPHKVFWILQTPVDPCFFFTSFQSQSMCRPRWYQGLSDETSNENVGNDDSSNCQGFRQCLRDVKQRNHKYPCLRSLDEESPVVVESGDSICHRYWWGIFFDGGRRWSVYVVQGLDVDVISGREVWGRVTGQVLIGTEFVTSVVVSSDRTRVQNFGDK